MTAYLDTCGQGQHYDLTSWCPANAPVTKTLAKLYVPKCKMPRVTHKNHGPQPQRLQSGMFRILACSRGLQYPPCKTSCARGYIVDFVKCLLLLRYLDFSTTALPTSIHTQKVLQWHVHYA